MKMIPSFKILSSNDLRYVQPHIEGDAWYKAYDALYDEVWQEHAFIWSALSGHLWELQKEEVSKRLHEER